MRWKAGVKPRAMTVLRVYEHDADGSVMLCFGGIKESKRLWSTVPQGRRLSLDGDVGEAEGVVGAGGGVFGGLEVEGDGVLSGVGPHHCQCRGVTGT